MRLMLSLAVMALAAHSTPLAWNVSAVDEYAASENATTNGNLVIGKRGLSGEATESYPKDHPHKCSCYNEGQLWCSFPNTGKMKDYDNNCEARRHVLDMIYTLCTLEAKQDSDEFFSWRNRKVRPGENIYQCWPAKIIPPHSSPYHVIFIIKNVGTQIQTLDEETCIELLRRPLEACYRGGTGDDGDGVVIGAGHGKWKYRTDPSTGLVYARARKPCYSGCKDHREYPTLKRYKPSMAYTWTPDLPSKTSRPLWRRTTSAPTTTVVHTATQSATILAVLTTIQTGTVTGTSTQTTVSTTTFIPVAQAHQ